MDNKRIFVKKILGVGAIASLTPSQWVRPIVSSVILPAHAKTSNTPETLTVFDVDITLKGGIEIIFNVIEITVISRLDNNSIDFLAPPGVYAGRNVNMTNLSGSTDQVFKTWSRNGEVSFGADDGVPPKLVTYTYTLEENSNTATANINISIF